LVYQSTKCKHLGLSHYLSQMDQSLDLTCHIIRMKNHTCMIYWVVGMWWLYCCKTWFAFMAECWCRL